MLMLFFKFFIHLLKSLKLFSLYCHSFLMCHLHLFQLLFQFILLCDLSKHLISHGLKISLQKFSFHLMRLTRIIANRIKIIGYLIFLQRWRCMSKRLIIKSIKIITRMNRTTFFRQLDYFKFLLFTYIKLINQFIMNLHQFLL